MPYSRLRQIEYMKLRRDRFKEQGICIACGKEFARKNRTKCIECACIDKIYMQLWIKKHPNYRKEWRKKHPRYDRDWLDRHPNYMKLWIKKHPNYYKNQYKKMKGGIK